MVTCYQKWKPSGNISPKMVSNENKMVTCYQIGNKMVTCYKNGNKVITCYQKWQQMITKWQHVAKNGNK